MTALQSEAKVTIETTTTDSEESQHLMAELWREIDQLYGNEVGTVAEFTGPNATDILFLIARREGIALGCGAIRRRSAKIAEVKRVYVRPAARRSGLARALMHALEQKARDGGFNEIWLETGLRQPGAMALYESLGYRRIAGFGDYKDDPLSVCYGKRLS